jgi:hypothetical protein
VFPLKIFGVALLLSMAVSAHADSFLDFSNPDQVCHTGEAKLDFTDNEPAQQPTDPPLQVDATVDDANPLAIIDPAFSWPDYSGG